MLPQEAIEEFKGLYEKRYDVQLSNEEASSRANNLFNLYKITYMGEPSIDDLGKDVASNHEHQSNKN
jgi:hypothetical protein